MLSAFPSLEQAAGAPAWFDLEDPTEDEVKEVERRTGLRVPTRDALSEVETSSRIFVEKGALYLSMPLITPAAGDETVIMPFGFVLTDAVLLTVRFAASASVDSVRAGLAPGDKVEADDLFARILEAMIDRSADRLEHLGAKLDDLSRSTFRVDKARRRDLAKASNALREVLRNLGVIGDRLSQNRDTLLGLDRISAFVTETPHCDISAAVTHRIKAVHGDVQSLNSYEAHLSNKVQFLLDATLGFINIEQNDIVKVLTVVSVVGVPPVLVAGIYGMNFKGMPELNWAWGYPYSLVLMVVSAILPLAWFKWRGWL
jgi:magnesium transporter